MANAANVRSLEAIQQFRVALLRFQEDATASLAGLRQEMDRVLQWLQHDRPHFWQSQIRRCHDNVDHARTALARCRLRSAAGDRPTCIDEQIALQKAKRALEAAHAKLEVVKRWSVKMQQKADEYRSRLGKLEQMLQQDIPKMLALIENMISAIERYAAVSVSSVVGAGSVESRSNDSSESGEAGNAEAGDSDA